MSHRAVSCCRWFNFHGLSCGGCGCGRTVQQSPATVQAARPRFRIPQFWYAFLFNLWIICQKKHHHHHLQLARSLLHFFFIHLMSVDCSAFLLSPSPPARGGPTPVCQPGRRPRIWLPLKIDALLCFQSRVSALLETRQYQDWTRVSLLGNWGKKDEGESAETAASAVSFSSSPFHCSSS